MTITLITLITLMFLLKVAILSAADSKPALATGMDPRVAEAMQTGPEHQRLGQLAGSWDVACSMWMTPTAPVMESRATSAFRAILGGRFLQGDFTGSFNGQPFTGLSLMGYDRAAKQYVSTWCDSMSTTFVCLTGTSSDNGRTITYQGEMVCPVLGRTAIRQVETHEGNDRFTLVMYQKPAGGTEFKSMDLVYSRRR